MSIDFVCPCCHRVLRAPESLAGALATCMVCRQKLVVPASASEAANIVLPQIPPRDILNW